MTSKWNNFLTRRRIKKIKIASNISWFTRFWKTTKTTCSLKNAFLHMKANFWGCIWWILPKPSKKVSTQIQSILASLLLEISPTMFVSRESLDLGEFENQKFFWFLMPFCIQNDLKVKKWILAKMADQNWFFARTRNSTNQRERFFSRGRPSVLIR